MTKQQKKNERTIAAASYILAFYQEIAELTNQYSVYINVVLELENKYLHDGIEKATDEERHAITQIMQLIRFHANKAYIQYKSIMPFLKIEDDENITTLCDGLKKNFVIDRKKLEELVIKFNQLLIKGVIKDLLETSQELVNGLYADDTATS